MDGAPKVCKGCNNEYTTTGRNQKRCVPCQALYKKEYMLNYHQSNYSRKGYSQDGEGNNNWKGGIGTYRRNGKSSCEECGSKDHLVVHHKDHDRYNNTADNLETLCRGCHQLAHGYCRDDLGRFTHKV